MHPGVVAPACRRAGSLLSCASTASHELDAFVALCSFPHITSPSLYSGHDDRARETPEIMHTKTLKHQNPKT
eukprot:3161121-Pyramimonas_sp.AAC.1